MKFLIFLALLVVVGCGTSAQPTRIVVPLAATPKNLIVDADMEADDMLALLYLLSRPDVKVTAIAIEGTGITRCDAGIRNTRAILETVGQPDIPIACGSETPLGGNHAFPTEWRDAADRFFGVNLAPKNLIPPGENAFQMLTRILETADAPVTIVALGPLTNLAETFAQNPALQDKLDMLYSMGGAVKVAGNVAAQQESEWNFYADPVAAAQVLAAGVPITLVPLDATNQIPVTREMLARFAAGQATPAGKLANEMMQAQRPLVEAGQYWLWDSSTAVLVTDATGSSAEEMKLVVDETSGATKQDANGATIRVVTRMDAARVEQILRQTLNGQFKRD